MNEQVKKAFNGLVINGVKAGILWDSKAQTFTGEWQVLAVLSFLLLLLLLLLLSLL